MRPRSQSGSAGASANSPILWLIPGGAPRRERGGLGPSAQAELGQDARHVACIDIRARLAQHRSTTGVTGSWPGWMIGAANAADATPAGDPGAGARAGGGL